MTGTVKIYYPKRGFGFITPDDMEALRTAVSTLPVIPDSEGNPIQWQPGDVFVHVKAVKHGTLIPGAHAEFGVSKDREGRVRAVKVVIEKESGDNE